MATVFERKDLRNFEARRRRHKKRMFLIIVSLLLLIVAATIFIFYKLNNIHYTDYKIMESIERTDSSSAKYTSFNQGIVRYSNDGAMAFDFNGNPIWNATYDMNNPIINTCDEYLVISDKGRKSLELFDNKGHVLTIEVLHPIIKAEVAAQGVVVVLMEGDDVNYIQLFSSTGQNLVDSRTTTENNGFPIDFSLSKDGKKLVSSYISINNGTVQSKVTFYNFSNVGQNYETRIVGGYDYGYTFVPKVEFINNEIVCVFGDDKIGIYSMKEIPKLIYEESFQSEIKSIFYNEEYIGIVQNSLEGDGQNLLSLYNTKGDKILKKSINYNYDEVIIGNKEMIFYSEKDWNILRINGNEKLTTTFEQNISHIFQINTQEYMLIDDSNMNKIKLSRK